MDKRIFKDIVDSNNSTKLKQIAAAEIIDEKYGKYGWNVTQAFKDNINYNFYKDPEYGQMFRGKYPESFCRFPFDHMQLSASGEITPCCKFNLNNQVPTNGDSLLNKNLEELWHNEDLVQLREQFMRGEKPKGCAVCWQEEESGIASMRQICTTANIKILPKLIGTAIASQSPSHIDIKLSSLCNLKCRICGPYLSTQWLKEYKDLNLINQDVLQKYSRFAQEKLLTNNDNYEIIKKWAKNLEMVEFYGGEPLLQQEHKTVLELLYSNTEQESVELFYNTNGTIFEEDFFKLWSKFKRVRINFSIDDIGPRFEYQRKNAKWDEVRENIFKYIEYAKKYKVNAEFSIYCTVNIFNIYYMPEFLAEVSSFNLPVWLNMVHFPDHFSIKNIPLTLKNIIKERLLSIDIYNVTLNRDSINFNDVITFMMNTPGDKLQFAKGMEIIERHDNYRQEQFSDVFPEIFELIKTSSNDNSV